MTLDDLTRWQRRIFDWQEELHDCHCGRMREVCDDCEIRRDYGCIGKKCPVHSLLDEINRAPNRTVRATRYVYDELVRKHQDA